MEDKHAEKKRRQIVPVCVQICVHAGSVFFSSFFSLLFFGCLPVSLAVLALPSSCMARIYLPVSSNPHTPLRSVSYLPPRSPEQGVNQTTRSSFAHTHIDVSVHTNKKRLQRCAGFYKLQWFCHISASLVFFGLWLFWGVRFECSTQNYCSLELYLPETFIFPQQLALSVFTMAPKTKLFTSTHAQRVSLLLARLLLVQSQSEDTDLRPTPKQLHSV